MPDFEPGKTTKKLWTYARKDERTVVGITLPGLFDISHFGIDALLFVVVIVLELWGLIILWTVGLPLISIPLAFLLDLTFAVSYHIFSMGKTCVLKNWIVVAELTARETIKSDNELEIMAKAQRLQQQYREKIRSRKFFAGIFALSIFALSALKIVGFYGLHEVFDIFTLAIFVSYVIVAILHIKVTGYFIFALLVECFLRKDSSRYVHQGEGRLTVGQPNRTTLIRTRNKLTEGRADQHEIKKVKEYEKVIRVNGKDEKVKEYEYQLGTHGILTDDQLSGLVGLQESKEAKSEVVLHGLKHQLDILQIGMVKTGTVQQATGRPQSSEAVARGEERGKS